MLDARGVDVRGVFQQERRNLELASMPGFLLPQKGRYGLYDYEKMFCADPSKGQDIFSMRGINRDLGCVVVVRPDQYVVWAGDAAHGNADAVLQRASGQAH